MYSLKLTLLPQNNWETPFLLGKPMFQGELLVLGRVDDDTTGTAFGKTEPKRTIPQVQEMKISS